MALMQHKRQQFGSIHGPKILHSLNSINLRLSSLDLTNVTCGLGGAVHTALADMRSFEQMEVQKGSTLEAGTRSMLDQSSLYALYGKTTPASCERSAVSWAVDLRNWALCKHPRCKRCPDTPLPTF